WYGQPFRLRPDQKRSLYRWYEACGGCGHWRYTQWIRSEATGGGKTQFMAAVEVLELGGPPQIAPVSPNIVSAANSWDQANKLFSAAAVMCAGQGGGGGRDERGRPAVAVRGRRGARARRRGRGPGPDVHRGREVHE